MEMSYVATEKRKEKKNSNAQDAHEAIRPTSHSSENQNSVKEFLSRDQFRLYKLIWERFVASQMAPAIMDTMSCRFEKWRCYISSKWLKNKVSRIYEGVC